MVESQTISLQIPEYAKIDGTAFFKISITKFNEPGKKHLVQHRYNDFVELDKQISGLGLSNLPKLPNTILFATEKNLEARRASLADYLQVLLSRKDTKYSQKLRAFLELDTFCPELMYKAPCRVVS